MQRSTRSGISRRECRVGDWDRTSVKALRSAWTDLLLAEKEVEEDSSKGRVERREERELENAEREVEREVVEECRARKVG